MTHASSRVSALRSVALTVPDLTQAEQFYTQTWHLGVAARTDNAIYLCATGADHHVLALHEVPGPARIRNVTLRARSAAVLQEVALIAPAAGGRVLQPVGPLDEPGGGTAVTVADADGRIFRLVHGDALHADVHEEKDRPVRLAHAVLNSHDVAATQRFMEQVFDFSLSDRTRIMAFMRCNSDHHSIALGDTDNDALNHIAFLMPVPGVGDAWRRPHAGRRFRYRVGTGAARPGRQRLQLFRRPVRRRHRIHRRGRAG